MFRRIGLKPPRSTRRALVRRRSGAAYLLKFCSRWGHGGSTKDGKIRRRTMTIAAPQRRSTGTAVAGAVVVSTVGRSVGLFEHQQAQQRDQALAVGVQKAIVARTPKALEQHVICCSGLPDRNRTCIPRLGGMCTIRCATGRGLKSPLPEERGLSHEAADQLA